MRIPFVRVSQIRRFPWRCHSPTIVEDDMAVRKRLREDEVFSNAAGIDVGGSSHWVAVPARSSDEPVREFGAMTDDLNLETAVEPMELSAKVELAGVC